jgi:hypothetical protein
MLAKGWISFALVPASVVIFPLFIAFQYLAARQLKQPSADPFLRFLQISQIAALLVFYVSIPALGDTDDTLLFGFLKGNINSTLATASSYVSAIALGALIVISGVLLLRLVLFNKFGKKAFWTASILFVLIAVGAVAYYQANQKYYCNGYEVTKEASDNCNKHGLSPVKQQ